MEEATWSSQVYGKPREVTESAPSPPMLSINEELLCKPDNIFSLPLQMPKHLLGIQSCTPQLQESEFKASSLSSLMEYCCNETTH